MAAPVMVLGPAGVCLLRAGCYLALRDVIFLRGRSPWSTYATMIVYYIAMMLSRVNSPARPRSKMREGRCRSSDVMTHDDLMIYLAITCMLDT